MASTHEAAYARAHGAVARICAAAPNPTAIADQVMAELRVQGWRWQPYEPPPVPGRAAPPPPEWEQHKQQLREIAERARREAEG